MIALVLNIAWLILGGGLITAFFWFLAGCIAFISILFIPWGRSCWLLAGYNLWPFGRDAVRTDVLYGRETMGNSPLGWVGNALWFVFVGLWLAIGHVTAAIAYVATIIGIPFAWVHIKLAAAAVLPIGMTVVDSDEATAARRRYGWKETYLGSRAAGRYRPEAPHDPWRR